VVILVLTSINVMAASDSLNSVWRDSFVSTYTEPSRSEFKKAKKLFKRQFAGEDSADLVLDWQEIGYDLMKWQKGDRELFILKENESKRLGRGLFVFPIDGVDGALVLQVPHGKSDLYTGKIAAKLITEHKFLAGAWNTAPRRYEQNGVAVNADMGKHTQSFFSAFTEALAVARKDTITLQLHGFSGLNRKTEAGANADAIVSPGVKKSRPLSDAYHACLRQELGKNVLLYPRDVNELGGTLNISGEILRQYRSHEFIHLELNKGLRDELRKKREIRKHLINCLQ
ncbi:MAG: hypothetical protein OER96_10915, partial [Gammaproteobacteria bacterium]|nr:hypothetical protein [Gammaproteobacteria bacterium]